ncbi:expressed unknown protein [Seminavis robusta]|uniref:Uncharacterized protein n=1 Tax=Seminavis robusta TaxID=568900 RepID=A0A9N8HZH7_9STRA|nr:expressed unknown protein [Seminavis robusta]|eukprot:Sro3670_g350120.1 n/a (163) ;mRNA; f:1645-2133
MFSRRKKKASPTRRPRREVPHHVMVLQQKKNTLTTRTKKTNKQRYNDDGFVDLATNMIDFCCLFFGSGICIYYDFYRTWFLHLLMIMISLVILKRTWWSWNTLRRNWKVWKASTTNDNGLPCNLSVTTDDGNNAVDDPNRVLLEPHNDQATAPLTECCRLSI